MQIKHFLIRWLPVLLWAAVIFAASANPTPYQALPGSWVGPVAPSEAAAPSRAELLGRFLHAGEYAVLAALTARALIWRSKARLSYLAAALGLAVLFALSDEVHQLYVPGRSFEVGDLALDGCGSLAGLAGYALIKAAVQLQSRRCL
ncbi:MAG: VanZ family protein [Pelolinea sp.]|nr:VanZ family protein [Pelolinea sp.]